MSNQNIHPILYYTPAIGWGILISYFSLLPGAEVPGMLKTVTDMLLHFSIYAGLAVLLLFAVNRFSVTAILLKTLLLIFLFCGFFGLTIEYLQENFAVGRQFEWSDVLFNCLGAAVILLLNAFLKGPRL